MPPAFDHGSPSTIPRRHSPRPHFLLGEVPRSVTQKLRNARRRGQPPYIFCQLTPERSGHRLKTDMLALPRVVDEMRACLQCYCHRKSVAVPAGTEGSHDFDTKRRNLAISSDDSLHRCPLTRGHLAYSLSRSQAPSSSPQNQAAKISPEQLDSLVAPIALYPDPLLAQTLAASTYPLEIIQLQQRTGSTPPIS
jgi:Protein of unknown function (DUF3300)